MKLFSATLFLCALGCFLHGERAEATTETVLYSFCSQQNCADGEQPDGGVIYFNGMLYGTTASGGAQGGGTLFSLDPNSGIEQVLHAFPGSQGDGFFPMGNLIESHGKFYGVTIDGGAYGYQHDYGGTVYSFDPANNEETVLYSFCRKNHCKDGSAPTGGVIINGKYYGTTAEGGTGGYFGTFFVLNLETGFERVRHKFLYESEDGYMPEGSLIYASGKLYGVTREGGSGACNGAGVEGCGTVFSLDPKSGAESVLHAFANGDTDGAFPPAGLLRVRDTLFGTTFGGGKGNCFFQGGATGCGTVYSFDLKSGAEKILYFFCSQQNCADGKQPVDHLVYFNGLVYGMTYGGGASGQGTVFSLDPKSGTENVVYSFCSQTGCADGTYPQADLIEVHGKLYGTTESGGAYGEGTVFSITP